MKNPNHGKLPQKKADRRSGERWEQMFEILASLPNDRQFTLRENSAFRGYFVAWGTDDNDKGKSRSRKEGKLRMREGRSLDWWDGTPAPAKTPC